MEENAERVRTAVHVSLDAAGDRPRETRQQRIDPGEALLRQFGGRLIGQPLDVCPGDDFRS
jgi:hypothetical protein